MDVLESLLQEALKHELRHRKGKGTVNRLLAIRQTCHTIYTNPENWMATRTIQLIHLETGESLGIFQEYTHRKTAARKLIRIEAADAQAEERVSGPEWIGPYHHRVDPPTEGELAHIRAAWRPKMWKPSWKHKVAAKTADQLLEELNGTSSEHH